MRASTASVTSSGEIRRARYRRASVVAGVKHRSRSGTAVLPGEALEQLARVQRVAQAVADVVDAEHGEEDGRPREDGPVGGEVQVVLGVEQDAAPRRDVGREAEAQERERRFGDDGGGDVD